MVNKILPIFLILTLIALNYGQFTVIEMTLQNFQSLLSSDPWRPPCCGLTVSPCTSSSIYRRLDASCNNLNAPEWGVPNSTYSRLLAPKYSDGISAPRLANSRQPLPSARLLRTRLFPTGSRVNNIFTLNAMQWGQFLAHDMSLTKEPSMPTTCCTGTGTFNPTTSRFCFPITVPVSDPTMGLSGIRCLNFTRTVTDRDIGCASGTSPANQINVVSSFLDLSNVYGLNNAMSRGLRSLSGGRLTTVTRNNRVYPPNESNVPLNCPCNLASETTCFRTGDSRSNQNPGLTILQILFVREHNRLAGRLAAINPQWDDERLFQEARRINIAAFQRISYYEYLPVILGQNNLVNRGIIFPQAYNFVNDYNPAVNPAVSSEHAQAAFRFFHTNIAGILNMYNSMGGVQSSTRISNWWNRPQVLENSISQLTMGLVAQNMEESDNIFVEPISDRFLACRDQGFGIDLRAADIQRDRDHGLAYYNDYRRYCGLRVAYSFDDFGDLISPANIAILKTLYVSHNDVDLSVGGALEYFANGAQCGPTFQCIMNEQFGRTRRSDRLWFENGASGFTGAQLAEIRKATAARIFCDNGDGITNMQRSAFVLPNSASNPITSCVNIPAINLEAWRTQY